MDRLAACYGGLFGEMSFTWQLEILVAQLFPEMELETIAFETLADCLERFDLADDRGRFRLFDRLFNDRHLRRLTDAHYYDYQDWFSKEHFEHLLLVLLQVELIRQAGGRSDDKRIRRILERLHEVLLLAEKTGFCCDRLVAGLDPTPRPELPLPATDENGLNVLFVASEATPFAKSGGLADVVGSLPSALRRQGHDVRVMIPAYRVAEDAFPLVKTEYSTEITLQGTAWRASVKEAVHDGVPYYFIDTPEFFDRPALYGTADGDYGDNGLRYGFFCRAVLEAVKLLDFRPDVIHHHDWQSSLLPVLLRTSYRDQEFFARTRTLLTIHNLGYQGMFTLGILPALELPYELGRPDALEYYGGIVLPEGRDCLCRPDQHRFSDLLSRDSGAACRGMVSMVSCAAAAVIFTGSSTVSMSAPGTRRPMPPWYSLTRRIACPVKTPAKKRCSRSSVWRSLPRKPLIAVISRLDRQKGINLIETIWGQLLERDVQFVLLGSGNNEQMRFWREEQGGHPLQVSINLTFNEHLSHRIYSAADLLLVPSVYEPCGLTQMIASRYGASARGSENRRHGRYGERY